MTDRPLTQRWVPDGYDRYQAAAANIRWTGCVTLEQDDGPNRALFPVVGLRPTPQLRALEARQHALHEQDGLDVNWRWSAMWAAGDPRPELVIVGVDLEYPGEDERLLIAWPAMLDVEFLEVAAETGMVAWTTAPRLTEAAWKRALCFEFDGVDVAGILAHVRAMAEFPRRPMQRLRPRTRGRRSELQRQPGRRRR